MAPTSSGCSEEYLKAGTPSSWQTIPHLYPFSTCNLCVPPQLPPPMTLGFFWSPEPIHQNAGQPRSSPQMEWAWLVNTYIPSCLTWAKRNICSAPSPRVARAGRSSRCPASALLDNTLIICPVFPGSFSCLSAAAFWEPLLPTEGLALESWYPVLLLRHGLNRYDPLLLLCKLGPSLKGELQNLEIPVPFRHPQTKGGHEFIYCLCGSCPEPSVI